MSRERDMALLEFCAAQVDSFNLAAWLRSDEELPSEVKAVAARFMMMSPGVWPGDASHLKKVSDAVDLTGGFLSAARRVGFDFSRFATMLSARLTYARPLS